MSLRRRHRRALRRTLTVLLVAMHGLIAAVGDGLHSLTPAAGSSHAKASSCSAGCCFCVAAAAPKAGRSEVERAADTSPGAPGHPEDCAVCELLAQMKTALASVQAPVAVVWAAAPQPPRSDAPVASLTLTAAAARGPPRAC